jgi:Ricin-type beta-trefoil lectin domain
MVIKKARVIGGALAALIIPAALVIGSPVAPLAAAGPAAGPAAAMAGRGTLPQTVSFDGYFVDNQTGRCLTISPYGAVSTQVCGQYGQLWEIDNSEILDVQLTCLDSNYSGSVYVLGCNGGNYQKWHFYAVGNGRYNVVDQQTGLCLDSNNSGSIYTLSCNGGNYQNWWLTTSIN